MCMAPACILHRVQWRSGGSGCRCDVQRLCVFIFLGGTLCSLAPYSAPVRCPLSGGMVPTGGSEPLAPALSLQAEGQAQEPAWHWSLACPTFALRCALEGALPCAGPAPWGAGLLCQVLLQVKLPIQSTGVPEWPQGGGCRRKAGGRQESIPPRLPGQAGHQAPSQGRWLCVWRPPLGCCDTFTRKCSALSCRCHADQSNGTVMTHLIFFDIFLK